MRAVGTEPHDEFQRGHTGSHTLKLKRLWFRNAYAIARYSAGNIIIVMTASRLYTCCRLIDIRKDHLHSYASCRSHFP